MITPALHGRVTAWIADDPDAGDRAELAALLSAARSGDEAGQAAGAELSDRFAGWLEFGTAGLRGPMAAGPNRMNRAVVRATTAALAQSLLAEVPAARNLAAPTPAAGNVAAPDPTAGNTAAPATVVIGCDARHRSAAFAAETAAVLAAAGIGVLLLPPCQPTPLLAFAVRHLSATAGVMITASHNPAADNGYKVYLADGAQLHPPAAAAIAARLAAVGPLARVAVAPADHPRIRRLDDEVARAYLRAVTGVCPRPPAPSPRAVDTGHAPRRPLRVVYTPLHGIAASLLRRAMRAGGYAAPHLVAEQAAPDPDFPTVAFPNPEEPGALDLALAEARRLRADLVLASDPDGDRLAVAVPDGTAPTGWRQLTGDQVGALLGDFLLARTAPEPDPGSRLVATTVVSATLLREIAAAAGARFAETLTGFKWIARAAEQVPGGRFVFGYEEALGYQVGEVVRDKDGIGAALAVLSLTTAARAAGQSLPDRLDALERKHGVHLTAPVTLPTRAPAAVMARLRERPPAELAGQRLTEVTDLAAAAGPGVARSLAREDAVATGATAAADGTLASGGIVATDGAPPPDETTALPPADVVIWWLPGARVVVRPSGTEPKLKAYLEVTAPAGEDLESARAAARARLDALRGAVTKLLAEPS